MSPRSATFSSAALARAGGLFSALGDGTRLALVARLSSDGPQSIARLTQGAEVSRQAVTKHLDVLAGAGVVRDFRRGRERIWQIDIAGLDEARSYLDKVSKRWDAALFRLKRFVEED